MNPHSPDPTVPAGASSTTSPDSIHPAERAVPAVVEKCLRRARLRWNWLRLVRGTSILGIVLLLFALALGTAILGGLVTTKTQALNLISILGAAALVVWIGLLVTILAGTPKRKWLAGALERVNPPLQDRLNTLLFLENKRPEAEQLPGFASRIARQTEQVLTEKTPSAPFSSRPAFAWSGSFLIVLACALWLDQRFAPFEHLHASTSVAAVRKKVSAPVAQLALPPTNNLEQNSPWGEVRITDPGTDLKLTKVDVVPLAIEAAANRDLKKVAWCSSVNGAKEESHALPPPADPRYATYQPTVYLDQLGLSDWDVMTYYAKAAADETNSFASEVYFLEIRPFREDILKMPGGQGGKAYSSLSEMTSLIGRQQRVIRETHQHVQRPPAQENVRAQDRQKLAHAESDLGGAVRHLYAEMVAKMENKPIGEALDNLAKAETSLGDASGLLQNNDLGPAQDRERAALSELVASRKIFQKAVSDHPGDFNEPNESDDSSPVADSSKKLSEMAEFRDEAKSAQEFVQRTLDQQKDLQQQARSGPPEQGAQLASEQEVLATNLNDFAEQHPRAFKGAEKESEQARQAMKRAAELMREKKGEAADAAQAASQNLEKLKTAMQGGADKQQLADAYRLKQMLDQEMKALGNQAKPGAKASPKESDEAAQAAQATVAALKKTIEQQAGTNAFGQTLREALSGAGKAELDRKLDSLRQAQTESERQERAGAAQAGLEQLGKAFTESEPKSLQAARQTDSLKPDPVEASAQVASKENQPELLNIDPDRLPPSYRGRIEKYFRKLSEK